MVNSVSVTHRSLRVLCQLLALFVSAGASAQTRATTADLVGVVYDQSGAVLPAANVTTTNSETNESRSTITDATGRFTLPALSPGPYKVTAGLLDFTSQTQDLVLQLGTQVELEFRLSLASIVQQVMVVASPPVVDRWQTALATVVTQQQINNLPINGRDFISFAVITPGVTRDNTPQQGASATSGLTFAGQRGRSNNITVDGLDNNDITVGSVRATFSQEAVREFQVVANSYSAEFGRASGGVMNVITKSGTNNPAATPSSSSAIRRSIRSHISSVSRQLAKALISTRRRLARSSLEAHSVGRFKKTKLSCSLPSSVWTSRPTTSSLSTTQPQSCCSGNRSAPLPAFCARPDSPSKPATYLTR